MLDGISPYYFASVRKTVTAFGTLFNNIKMARTAEVNGAGTTIKTIKVPIAYAPAQSYISWLRGAHSISRSTDGEAVISKTLPRMAYALKSMTFDKTRALGSMGRINNSTETLIGSPATRSTVKSMLQPMPWNFDFELLIVSKNLDDGYNIMEQILPNFKPTFPLTVNFVPGLELKLDVPVVFNGITQSDNYELQIGEKRLITWTLDFTAKSYIFPPLSDIGLIKRVINPMFSDTDATIAPEPVVTIITEVNPFEAEIDDPYTVVQEEIEGSGVREATGAAAGTLGASGTST